MKKPKSSQKFRLSEPPSPHSKNLKRLKYHRLILKISGEMLGTKSELFDRESVDYVVEQIITANRLGTRIGVVVGGGNIMRGRKARWLNKVDADMCGMIATVINGIIIHSQLQKKSISAKLSSGIDISGIVRRSNKFEDMKFYDSGGLLIFLGGTGNPLFTTDTAAALRAGEFGADILIKATNVEGVFSSDPKKSRQAKLYRKLTFDEAIAQNLAIMDMAAFNICRESNIPICVYDLMKYPLKKIVEGSDIGTLITKGG